MYSAEQTHAKPTDGYSRSRTENNALEEAQATEKEKKRNVFQMILKWELNEKGRISAATDLQGLCGVKTASSPATPDVGQTRHRHIRIRWRNSALTVQAFHWNHALLTIRIHAQRPSIVVLHQHTNVLSDLDRQFVREAGDEGAHNRSGKG